MSRCANIRAKFSEYLDGRLTGREMQPVARHMEKCAACEAEFAAMRHSQALMSSLGPVPEPDGLLLRIQVAVSHERARSRKPAFAGLQLAWRNALAPFLLQAGAGFASAVLLLGSVTMLVGMVAQPEVAQAKGDVPLGDATGPRLLYLSSVAGNTADDIQSAASPVIVEAYVNGEGQVYDFRIVSGPNDAATRTQVENVLMLSRFEPAKFFGQPVRGLAVLSFSGVSVRG